VVLGDEDLSGRGSGTRLIPSVLPPSGAPAPRRVIPGVPGEGYGSCQISMRFAVNTGIRIRFRFAS